MRDYTNAEFNTLKGWFFEKFKREPEYFGFFNDEIIESLVQNISQVFHGSVTEVGMFQYRTQGYRLGGVETVQFKIDELINLETVFSGKRQYNPVSELTQPFLLRKHNDYWYGIDSSGKMVCFQDWFQDKEKPLTMVDFDAQAKVSKP